MDKKQIEAEIKAKKEAIKQANRELSKLQDELKKKDEPLTVEFISACYDGSSNIGEQIYYFTVKANRIIGYAEIKRAIESLSDPVEPKNYIDWSRIPKGYDWVAMEKDGLAYCYEKRPFIDGNTWFCTRDNNAFIMLFAHDYFGGDWRDSLIYRPGVKE